MGPPEFTGGNLTPSVSCIRSSNALQWGRRNSPAETGSVRALWTLRVPASMGPPEFTGGNLPEQEGVGRARHASMGPPEFTGGNLRRGIE